MRSHVFHPFLSVITVSWILAVSCLNNTGCDCRKNQEEDLKIADEKGAAQPDSLNQRPVSEKTRPKDKKLNPFGIEQLSETRWSVFWPDLNKEHLESKNKVSGGPHPLPVYKNGKIIGFKISYIRPNSVYACAGFRNGDVFTGINGMKIGSPDAALEVYIELKRKSPKKVVVEIIRNGEEMKLEYEIIYSDSIP